MTIIIDPEAHIRLGIAGNWSELAAMVPSDSTLAAIDEAFDDWSDDNDGIYEEAVPLDLGVTVDDEPWGWLPVWEDRSDGDNIDSWRLVPLDIQDRLEPLAHASAWMSASMTGGVYTAQIDHCPILWLEWWRLDDMGVTHLEIGYGPADATLAERPAEALFGQIFDGWIRFCPCCDDQGWVLSLDSEGYKRAYQTCELHRSGCSFRSDNQTVRWTGTDWSVEPVQ